MKIYIIAGEASGDLLGGQVMASLKTLNPSVSFAGVGGNAMISQGLSPLFPMHLLSVMGFIEVIPALPKILKCLREVIKNIRQTKPDLILTIDAPAFTYRVAKKVKRLGIPLFHITAPTVWAWRPKRAEAFARVYDHLFCLFPFEPPYFEKEGLPSTFIGHPLVDILKSYQKSYNPQGPLLLLPGSRAKEIQTFLPLFQGLLNQHPELLDKGIILPTLPSFKDQIQSVFSNPKIKIITEEGEKYFHMADARLALAASGTVTLELALLGVPMIMGYRIHPLSAWILKRLIRTPFISLVNILLNHPLVPELLQENCTIKAFSQAIFDEKRWQAQRAYLVDLKKILLPPAGQTSGNVVARKILDTIKG